VEKGRVGSPLTAPDGIATDRTVRAAVADGLLLSVKVTKALPYSVTVGLPVLLTSVTESA